MIVLADAATYIVGSQASGNKTDHPVMAGMIDENTL